MRHHTGACTELLQPLCDDVIQQNLSTERQAEEEEQGADLKFSS